MSSKAREWSDQRDSGSGRVKPGRVGRWHGVWAAGSECAGKRLQAVAVFYVAYVASKSKRIAAIMQ